MFRPLAFPLLTSPLVGATAAFDACRTLAGCLPVVELSGAALPIACSLRLVMLTQKASLGVGGWDIRSQSEALGFGLRWCKLAVWACRFAHHSQPVSAMPAASKCTHPLLTRISHISANRLPRNRRRAPTPTGSTSPPGSAWARQWQPWPQLPADRPLERILCLLHCAALCRARPTCSASPSCGR